MPVDIAAAEQFIHATARLLDRHRLAVLLGGAPVEPVLAALRAYQNPDGGFGHALEPDVRDPASQPTATLHALEVLAEVGALDDPMVGQAADWVARNDRADGALPFVLPSAANHPHAPWMAPNLEGSFITFGVVSVLTRAGIQNLWLNVARAWCWYRIDRPDTLNAYWVKFALDFLDHEPDEDRARAAIESLRPKLGADGTDTCPGRYRGRAPYRPRSLTTPEPAQPDAVHRGAHPGRPGPPRSGAARGRRLDVRLARLVAGAARRVARCRDTARPTYPRGGWTRQSMTSTDRRYLFLDGGTHRDHQIAQVEVRLLGSCQRERRWPDAVQYPYQHGIAGERA